MRARREHGDAVRTFEDGEIVWDYGFRGEIRGRERVGAPETADRKNGKSIERHK